MIDQVSKIFTNEAVSIVNEFITKQKQSISISKEWYHPIYLDGFNELFSNGFDFELVKEKLQRVGWVVKFVDGYLSGYEYFNCLNNKIIPVISTVRPMSQIDYAEFPDMIHDIMGHIPMLLNEQYTDFLDKMSSFVCSIELEELDRKYLLLHEFTFEERNNKLAEILKVEQELKNNPTPFYIHNNLALWTIEFGLIGNNSPYQAYGAAIVGSPAEINNLKSGSLTNITQLDQMTTDTSFNFSDFQENLYSTMGFDDVLEFHECLAME
jgi:phenylalanine-4-hydroxylase